MESHKRAAHAQATGAFNAEIVPTEAIVKNENGEETGTFVVHKDDGVRGDTTIEVGGWVHGSLIGV